MKINRIWKEVNSSGTLNSEVKEIINYIEDCTYEEERQRGHCPYTDFREVGEIFIKDSECYLTYRIVNDMTVKGGLIKFEKTLLPLVYELLWNDDKDNWVRLIVGEGGGVEIWHEDEFNVQKDEEECNKLDKDVFSEIYKKMSLIKTLSTKEWASYYKSLESLGYLIIHRMYTLLDDTDTDDKGTQYLLKYEEEICADDPEMFKGLIYKKDGYCYLECRSCLYGSADPNYNVYKFDESLFPEIYKLCKNEYQENTIEGYVSEDKRCKHIRWQHSKYYIWEDEEEYGPHDPNDPRYNYSYTPIETIEDEDVGPLPF